MALGSVGFFGDSEDTFRLAPWGAMGNMSTAPECDGLSVFSFGIVFSLACNRGCCRGVVGSLWNVFYGNMKNDSSPVHLKDCGCLGGFGNGGGNRVGVATDL